MGQGMTAQDFDNAYDRQEALGQDATYDPALEWDFVPVESSPVSDAEQEAF